MDTFPRAALLYPFRDNPNTEHLTKHLRYLGTGDEIPGLAERVGVGRPMLGGVVAGLRGGEALLHVECERDWAGNFYSLRKLFGEEGGEVAFVIGRCGGARGAGSGGIAILGGIGFGRVGRRGECRVVAESGEHGGAEGEAEVTELGGAERHRREGGASSGGSLPELTDWCNRVMRCWRDLGLMDSHACFCWHECVLVSERLRTLGDALFKFL